MRRSALVQTPNSFARRLRRIALAGPIVLASVALAAAPYDGQWEGIIESGGSCAAASLTATVLDGYLMGQSTTDPYQRSIAGTIAADGSLTIQDAEFNLKGKFEGKHFSGVYYSSDCRAARKLELDKRD